MVDIAVSACALFLIFQVTVLMRKVKRKTDELDPEVSSSVPLSEAEASPATTPEA